MRAANLLSRLSFALLLALGCSSKGSDGGTGPGPAPTIALSLGSSAASVVQGGNAQVPATLTRAGGYTGTVGLEVQGAPAGVTGAVSNLSTSGGTTTATVTISVAAATAPGTYNLTVIGTGSGVSQTQAPFTLTVTAAPDFGLSIAPAAASVVQGGSSTPIAVTITRTNFSDPVTLSLGGTVPAGVTAAFTPAAPTANTASLTVTVGATTAPGTYNLTVAGTGAPGTRTTPLVLTVTSTPPDYSLSVNPGTASIGQGGSQNNIVVTILRTNFPGAVTLSLGGTVPAGVTAVFAPASPTGNSSTLTITVGALAPIGTYELQINGTGTPGARSRPFSLTITAPASFTLAVAPVCPGGASLEQGAFDDARTIAINRTNFPQGVLLTAENLPAGLSADFGTNPTTGNSARLALTASGTVVPGTYTLTIRGSGSGVEATAPLPVTITAGPAATPNVLEYSFSTGTAEGWAGGATCLAQNQIDWGQVNFQEDMVVLDGRGPIENQGQPNAWISKVIALPANATTLQFDVSAHVFNGADARLRVRILDGGQSFFPFDQVITGSAPVRVFTTRSANIAPWAGKTVRVFFEQDDNGFAGGVFPGSHEQIWLDNIRFLGSLPSSWLSRRPIIVTTGAAGTPNEYSLSLQLDHAAMVGAGKSLASGNDVRVVYWTGTQYYELDRILDPGSAWNTATTRIWFKSQAAIGANGSNSTNYFLYYGNPAAGAPPANRARVFLAHDTFELGNLSKWAEFPNSLWAADNTRSHAGIFSGMFPAEPPNSRVLVVNVPTPLNVADVYTESWWYLNSASTAYKLNQGVRNNSNGDFYHLTLSGPPFGWGIAKEINGMFTQIVSVPATPPVNTWIRVGAAIQGSTMRIFVDGAEVAQATGLTELTSGNVGFDKFEVPAGAGWWVDDFIARRYVNPEPGSGLGAEQVGPFAAGSWVRAGGR